MQCLIIAHILMLSFILVHTRHKLVVLASSLSPFNKIQFSIKIEIYKGLCLKAKKRE